MAWIDEIHEAASLVWKYGDMHAPEVEPAIKVLAGKLSMSDWWAFLRLLDDVERWRSEVPTQIVEAVS